jgi:hypothetical protein
MPRFGGRLLDRKILRRHPACRIVAVVSGGASAVSNNRFAAPGDRDGCCPISRKTSRAIVGSRGDHLDASTTLLPHGLAFMRMKLVYRAGSGTFNLGERQK